MNAQNLAFTNTTPSAAIVWIGRLAMILSAVASVMLCAGDPYWLTLPLGVLGVALGGYAMRQDHGHRAGSNIGVWVGIVTIALWFLVVPLFSYMGRPEMPAVQPTAEVDAANR